MKITHCIELQGEKLVISCRQLRGNQLFFFPFYEFMCVAFY